jgi:ABC-type lipoprotein release transport system permease subunit
VALDGVARFAIGVVAVAVSLKPALRAARTDLAQVLRDE